MRDYKLYHYAVIRLVPRVEREEFFNVGLIIFCKRDRYIRFEYHLCPEKFRLMHTQAAYADIVENLELHKRIAHGNPHCGPIALLDVPERFRWLTAVRSTIIQSSRSHPGKTENLDRTFDRLFDELVK